MKKVSFVVPVYNVEKYLEKCIQSILNQSYSNLELILVNDGSPDDSQRIIEKYKKIDKRIISIKKKNEGVSAARNDGIEIATGDYILFVDSDDYIEKNYAEYLIELIENNDSDMALSYNYFDDCGFLPKEDEIVKIINSKEASIELYLGKTGVAVWNKIYKKSLLDKYRIRFNEKFWFAEGMTFNLQYFQKCKNIVCGNKKVYHQIYNYSSAVRKFNLESWKCGMTAMKYQLQFINNEKEVINAWNYHYYEYYFHILKGIIQSKSEREYQKEINECKKMLKKSIIYSFKVKIPMKRKIKRVIISFFPKISINLLIKREKKRSIV